MTDREKKSMKWAGGLLLGAALVRFLVAPAPAAPPLDGRPSIGDSLLVAGDAAVEEKARRSRPFEPGETIDPNVAGDEELDRLPGVGPARALDIVRDREENGPFAKVEDLARVRGIGPAGVERMRPHLRLDPAAMRGAGARMGEAGAVAAGGGGLPSGGVLSSGGQPRGGLANRGGPAGPGGPTGGVPAASAPVDLNRATAEELQTLPGIGPAIAERILAYRDENGPFRRADELMRVKGVGEKTFARIAPHVTVGR